MVGAQVPADQPLVVVKRIGSRRQIAALDDCAGKLGLRPGMAITLAQALAPSLQLVESDEAADQLGLEKLALWALERLSPIVAVDGQDGLVIDTTGADHLHGGEKPMLIGLVKRLLQSGVQARVGIADTWGAAHALARFSGRRFAIAPPGSLEAALEELPLQSLRLPREILPSLLRLGFETVGDLCRQPRPSLALRFGHEIGMRLDQAFGLRSELIDPVRPQEMVREIQNFPEPIGAPETIIRYLTSLTDKMCVSLEQRGLGARRVDLVICRVDGSRFGLRIGTAQPVRDPSRILRLFREKIGLIDPGFGIEAMELAAVVADEMRPSQAVSGLGEPAPTDLSELVDVLSLRVGAAKVYRAVAVPSDVPERSFRRVGPLEPVPSATWEGEWPRPVRLLARPEPIETMALLPDNPPAWFSWRGVRRRVARADGPERIQGEWWKRDAEMDVVRDYFRVEDENGERFWIYRSGDGERPVTGSHRWYLHGIFG